MPEPKADLRSDTKTKPTPAMREAMARAEVGDASTGEDPTVNALEERAASLFGKEAALFVNSGTLANQLAIKAHTQPGDELICDSRAHPFRSELSAAAVISGVQFALLPGERGIYSREAAVEAIRPDGGGNPRTAVIWVENTHNNGGGLVYPMDALRDLRSLALERNIPMHMDGARIFNGVVASGIPPREWAAQCDTTCFCLSKGLGCPVGSVLLGPAGFIRKAKRFWRMLGGAWRQAGNLAAAGLHALDHHVERLAEDHANAQRFAERTAGIPQIRHVYDTTPTNIVFLDVAETGLTAQEVNERVGKRGVAFSIGGPTVLRAVTHLDVSQEDVDLAASALEEAVA